MLTITNSRTLVIHIVLKIFILKYEKYNFEEDFE